MDNNRPQLMSRPEAAAYLGIQTQTLAAWACSGRYGVPYVKIGRSVRYRKSDLDAWLAARTVTSTGQAEAKART